jgi:protein-tyrosine-phosphatase
MAKRGVLGLSMCGLGVGYFLWYTPYSGLAKAISGGLLPGIHHPVGGLMLLPATVLGQLVAMPVYVSAGGWLRYSGRRRIAGRSIPFPSRYTAESAVWMALIVGTTTLNFTFPGASIVLMLVLMRISTIVISPIVDLLRQRKIHWYSAAALTLCLFSAGIALTDIHNYKLTAGALLSLGCYALGYYMRFRIMSTRAKTGNLQRDRQYFIEEHMTTPFVLLLMAGIPALIDQGPWMHALRLGFTSFLGTPAVIPALAIGVCYEGLFIMTSLIFLNRREYCFCAPVHVCSSLIAGVAASLILHGAFGAALPDAAQYVAALMVIGAACILSYQTIKAYLARRQGRLASAPGLIMFVCGGNTSRSPMAAAIARAELAANGGPPRWPVGSAGVSVRLPGEPISPEALTALVEMGVDAPVEHRSRQLTPEMCTDTKMVYCMTRTQRDLVVALAPAAAARTVCLDPEADVPDPAGQPLDAYRDCAARFRTLIRARLREQLDPA